MEGRTGVTRRITQTLVAGGIAIMLGAAGVAVAGADRDDDEFDARLQGFQEVPVVSTVASGRFEAEIDDHEIRFELSYRGLEAPILFAHIHPGQKDVNGGVAAFFCGGGGKPPCPQEGTVEGTITPADVVSSTGATNQGFAAGEFEELVEAIEAGVTYANVHSQKFPGGEIRGQIREDD
jgi:CHRD domain